MNDLTQSRRRGLSFFELILGQLLTAAITIGAVWLTSKQAFDQNMRTTQYDDATRTVHMLQVIRAELSANMDAVEEYAAYIDSLEDSDEQPDPGRMFLLSHDCFDCAPQNDRYYLLGADTIIALRAFYRESDRLQRDMSFGGMLNPGSDRPSPRNFRRQVRVRLTGLDTYICQIRTALLPRLTERVDELEAVRKKAYGADVKPIPELDPIVLPRLDGTVEVSTESSGGPGGPVGPVSPGGSGGPGGPGGRGNR